jgi:hypothetical protein
LGVRSKGEGGFHAFSGERARFREGGEGRGLTGVVDGEGAAAKKSSPMSESKPAMNVFSSSVVGMLFARDPMGNVARSTTPASRRGEAAE